MASLGQAICLCVVSIVIAVRAPLAHAQSRLSVEGTEFVLTTDDGRILRSPDLVGATLNIKTRAGQIEITIKSVEKDPTAVGGWVFLHHFVIKDRTGRLVDLCTPDATGRSLGFPVPDGKGGFDMTCTSGVIGKCIRWGYRPWDETHAGAPLRALHRACVFMARADYGGDGHPTTRENTAIYVCDRYGVRPCEKNAPLKFEAAWGTEGAVCVARPRISDNITLDRLAINYPRLKAHLGPVACTQESAMRDPTAILFNRSQ
jgi:ADYC domain-containing protein